MSRLCVGTNAYLWRNVIREVSGHRRCIAVDLPCTGNPRVANDTGGAIAQIFAARRPERIRSIALTNCETHDNVPPPAFKSTIRLARGGSLSARLRA